MILLVISMHAADTYSPLGSWYYVDRAPLTRSSLLVFAAWQMYLQAFFMGLLFFIAGIFVPGSLERKGPRAFLKDRAFRLGVPVLFYMFVLGPVTEYYFAHSWNSTEPTSMAHEWIKHIRNGEFLQENGPLWFCLALLIFCVGYVTLRRWAGDRLAQEAPESRRLVGFALVMAVGSFLVRAVRPPTVFNLHFGDFAQYVLLFGAGTLAARHDWLSKLPYTTGLRWLWTLPAGFVFWLALLALGGATGGNGDAYSGGWHWQSAGFCLWESFTCVALSVGLLAVYREKFGVQGRAARFLSENAFSVYVFHPPIVIAGARLIHGGAWPSLVKFGVLTAFGVVVSFGLSELVFRRMPVLKAML